MRKSHVLHWVPINYSILNIDTVYSKAHCKYPTILKFLLEPNALSGKRQTLSKLLSGIAIAGLYLSVPSQTTVAEQDQTALILEQENSLIGPLTVIACRSAIKIIEKRSGVMLISKSPDWKVTAFNTQTKRIFSTPFKQYSAAKDNGTQNIFTAFQGLTVSDIPLQKCEPGNFLNFPVNKFKAPNSFEKRMLERRKMKIAIGSTPANVDFQTLNSPAYGSEESNILARTTGCAEINQLPIQLVYTGTDNKHYNWLVTKSIKKTQIDDKAFITPSDYKAVKSEAEIHESKATTEGVMDLFEMRYGR